VKSDKAIRIHSITNTMPSRCVAADCRTGVDSGCSFHKFPSAKDRKEIHMKWIRAVKQYRKNWA